MGAGFSAYISGRVEGRPWIGQSLITGELSRESDCSSTGEPASMDEPPYAERSSAADMYSDAGTDR